LESKSCSSLSITPVPKTSARPTMMCLITPIRFTIAARCSRSNRSSLRTRPTTCPMSSVVTGSQVETPWAKGWECAKTSFNSGECGGMTLYSDADYALARDNEHNGWDEFLSIRGDWKLNRDETTRGVPLVTCRSRKNPTTFCCALSGLSRDGGARRERDGVLSPLPLAQPCRSILLRRGAERIVPRVLSIAIVGIDRPR
jgi:hypothetical protein